MPTLDGLNVKNLFGQLDIVVKEESLFSQLQLQHELSFPDGCPIIFNEKLHRNGVTTWQDENALSDCNAELLDNLQLQWCQLVGIKAMARLTFLSTQADVFQPGVLMADEVGLGKTAQLMGFDIFVNQVAEMQVRSQMLPAAVGVSIVAQY